jgi:hypothetical protein
MCRTIEAGEVILEDRAAVEAPSTSNRFFIYAFLFYSIYNSGIIVRKRKRNCNLTVNFMLKPWPVLRKGL